MACVCVCVSGKGIMNIMTPSNVHCVYIQIEECAMPYEKRLIGKWFLSIQQNVKRQGLKRLPHSPISIDENAVEMWPMAVQGVHVAKGQCVLVRNIGIEIEISKRVRGRERDSMGIADDGV